MPSQRQGYEVIGRGLVTVMASSSANVEASPTAGVQVSEGPLAAEVLADIFFPHSGALSSNAGADAGGTNAASTGDTNASALCELLPMKLGIGGGPCWPPAIHPRSPSSKEGIMAVIVAPSWSRTCSWTISGIHATCALSSLTSRSWLSELVFLSLLPAL